MEIDLTTYFKYAEPMEKAMDFDEWLAYGIAKGFCSEQVCETHGWLPYTDTEDVLFEQGHDPCRHIVRLGNETDWENDAKAYLDLTNDKS